MRLDLVVDPSGERVCARCKWFKGDGELCEKCGRRVSSGFLCYAYGWKLKEVEFKDGLVIEGNLKEVEVNGDRVIIAEPLFGFEEVGEGIM